eukprot:GHVU01111336.1.p1 GENE.GHVU01111336.1~~GHVU01111336.1.p1  ORF type:complete len:227 (+),score=21.50 GHVU01111336.1:2235-2915(+)
MEAICLDCESVKTRSKDFAVVYVCLVNERLELIFSSYIDPGEQVIDYRSAISGIKPSDLVGAPSLLEVRSKVMALIRGKLVVGHSVSRSDLPGLGINHPPEHIRDTADLPIFLNQSGMSRKLKDLAFEFLGITIQTGVHCAFEDSKACMKLYKKFWNISGAAPDSFAAYKRRRDYEPDLNDADVFAINHDDPDFDEDELLDHMLNRREYSEPDFDEDELLDHMLNR